jgi:putative transposase
LLDQLVTGPMSPAVAQEIASTFKKALYERILGAGLSHHLVGYKVGEARPPASGNHRNGARGKTVLTEDWPLRLKVPCDRDGSFEPMLIPKHERRFTGPDA